MSSSTTTRGRPASRNRHSAGYRRHQAAGGGAVIDRLSSLLLLAQRCLEGGDVRAVHGRLQLACYAEECRALHGQILGAEDWSGLVNPSDVVESPLGVRLV